MITHWHRWRQLSWAHFRVLIPVADARLRRSLTTEANRNAWSVVQLEERMRALAAGVSVANDTSSGVRPSNPLIPRRGVPGLHIVVERGDIPAVDLGFKLYQPLTPGDTGRFAKGAIVRLSKGTLTLAPDATKDQLFTYAATVRRVVDGDTLIVAIALRPSLVLEARLRLRGLDCPEMDTPEGAAAKRFVEERVAQAKSVTIATFKPDKYDRYLADVFIEPGMADGSGSKAKESFLNNELLKNGHAVRKDEYALTDWGE
ncbi:MAG: thermonuclease family protein [Verrucomicrobia bacterium]|nr:thermonuclease family protein [Verrucomicrobiota bacterium]